jgi:hypothetical protein
MARGGRTPALIRARENLTQELQAAYADLPNREYSRSVCGVLTFQISRLQQLLDTCTN